MKLAIILITMGLLISVLTFIYISKDDIRDQGIIINEDNKIGFEKVGVYYNLDNPNKTYIRDGDNFKEVEING